jgi:hypothetical protein
MRKAEAVAHGFTHHGRMFSVPCWVTIDDCPMVAAKFAPLELWIEICSYAVQFMGACGMDVAFPIGVGRRIEDAEPPCS